MYEPYQITGNYNRKDWLVEIYHKIVFVTVFCKTCTLENESIVEYEIFAVTNNFRENIQIFILPCILSIYLGKVFNSWKCLFFNFRYKREVE